METQAKEETPVMEPKFLTGTIKYEIKIDEQGVLTMDLEADKTHLAIISALTVEENIAAMEDADNEIVEVINRRKAENKPTKAFTKNYLKAKDRQMLANTKNLMGMLVNSFIGKV
jgi:hypothetical protein